MNQPWFDPIQFGTWYGAIGGAVGGTLGGTLGTLGGILVPRGIGRTWMLGAFYLTTAAGILQLCFGFYAMLAGQPWDIWFGPILCGFVFTLVFGLLTPVLRMQYRQAEERRMEAEALRKS
jgi:hypothetical protein